MQSCVQRKSTSRFRDSALRETFVWITQNSLLPPFMHCLHCVKGLAGCIGPLQTTFVWTLSPPFCTLPSFPLESPACGESEKGGWGGCVERFSRSLSDQQLLVLIWICSISPGSVFAWLRFSSGHSLQAHMLSRVKSDFPEAFFRQRNLSPYWTTLLNVCTLILGICD